MSSINPDGSLLAFHSNDTLYIIDLSDGLTTLVSLLVGTYYDFFSFYWTSNSEIGIIYHTEISYYDIINNSYRSSDFELGSYYYFALTGFPLLNGKYLFITGDRLVFTNYGLEIINEIKIELGFVLSASTMDQNRDYLIGSLTEYYSSTYSKIRIWDNDGLEIGEWMISLPIHDLDWDNLKQRVAGAGNGGNFTIFTLPTLVMDAVKQKNMLYPLGGVILIILIVYLIKRYVFHKEKEERRDLYPSDNN